MKHYIFYNQRLSNISETAVDGHHTTKIQYAHIVFWWK